MSIDFELILTLAVIITGLISLWDVLVSARGRQRQGVSSEVKLPILVEYSKSFFPVLLLVLLLRSFIAEPFRIPSGSDEPTLLVGDLIVANKFSYGLRLPVIHTKIYAVGEPQRGQIILFRWPVNTSLNFIKRVVGVPGDRISYRDKVLYINGQEQKQNYIGQAVDVDGGGPPWPVTVMQENLNGVEHKIYLRQGVPAQDFSLVVPPGEYFVMGDNRDDSNDSRYWGFVPEQNLLGKAFAIWFSWDSDTHQVRWHRIGMRVY